MPSPQVQVGSGFRTSPCSNVLIEIPNIDSSVNIYVNALHNVPMVISI